jgi:hypothetical protein
VDPGPQSRPGDIMYCCTSRAFVLWLVDQLMGGGYNHLASADVHASESEAWVDASERVMARDGEAMPAKEET